MSLGFMAEGIATLTLHMDRLIGYRALEADVDRGLPRLMGYHRVPLRYSCGHAHPWCVGCLVVGTVSQPGCSSTTPRSPPMGTPPGGGWGRVHR